MKLRTCRNPECRKPFPPTRYWQRDCTKGCHDRYHNLRRGKILKRDTQARRKGGR